MPPPIRVRSPARLEASKLREAELYKERTAARPWYRRGGMHVTEKGAFLTFLVPSLVLAVELLVSPQFPPFPCPLPRSRAAWPQPQAPDRAREVATQARSTATTCTRPVEALLVPA